MPRCRICKSRDVTKFGLSYFCGFDHAAQWAIENRSKGESKRDRAVTANRKRSEREARIQLQEKKESVRPLRWYANKAREACHEYIRERDKADPCISCGRWHSGQHHASHYRPSGTNSALRYDESNIHKSCAPCNTHLSGNLTNYRIRLIQKIGEAAVLALEENRQIRKYDKAELIAIRRHYQEKLKLLRAES
jgi:hypothetical protein